MNGGLALCLGVAGLQCLGQPVIELQLPFEGGLSFGAPLSGLTL